MGPLAMLVAACVSVLAIVLGIRRRQWNEAHPMPRLPERESDDDIQTVA